MEKYLIRKRDLVTVIESPVDFISVDHEKCVGCKDCVIICGMELWKIRDSKAVLEPEYKKYCTECASCYTVCGYDAIEFTFPPAGYGIVYERG
jgi:Fe-S-cluster-containing hydrogenase component 2